MVRSLIAGIAPALLLVTSIAWSAEPSATRRQTQRRQAVERQLDQPLEWDVADKSTVTIEEFIQHVREQHGLAIRWDSATFTAMGGGGMLSLGYPRRSPSYVQTSYYPSAPASPCPGGVCPDGMTVPPPLTWAGDLPYAVAQSYAPPLGSAPPVFLANAEPVAPATAATPVNAAPPAQPVVESAKPAAVPSAAAPIEKPTLLPPSPEATTPQKLEPIPPPQTGQLEASPPKAEGSDEELPHLAIARMPISVAALSLNDATIGEVLAQLLDSAMPPIVDGGEMIGLPLATRAMTLDYLIQGNAIVITTHLRANASKETRVYSTTGIKAVQADDLVRVITHSVRPWSWRTQANEIAERLAARWPKGDTLQLPKINLDLNQGISFASNETTAGAGPVPEPQKPISEEAVAATGQLLAGGAVAAVQSLVAAAEIIHHGDPPTAVIEVLPGRLVITQSQGAHREIAELLEQLQDENAPQ
jgi:hypothetical protein